jgi:hypothetical protein
VAVALHLVYRSSGKENAKARPPFYGKALALASFLRSARRCPEVESLVFLNDAPLAPSILQVMAGTGEVLNQEDLILPRSYRQALALPRERGWPPDDLVYFSEDDYLYRPEAFAELARAAREVPEASYFSFYATTGRDEGSTAAEPGWHAAETTTSSFGARIGALAADRWLHLFGSRAQGAFDQAVCLAYQGHHPYTWRQVVTDGSPGARARAVGTASRLALNLVAHGRRHRPRVLVTRVPSLATHMEEPHMAEGVDWAAVAADTARWADEAGMGVRAAEAASP